MHNGTQPLDPRSWESIVDQLAQLPITIANLLGEHYAQPDGMCGGCTDGGTGRHQTPAPCSLQQVAEAARAHRAVAAGIPEQRQ